MKKTLGLMDDYYKFERKDFEAKMIEVLGTEPATKIFSVIDNKDISLLQ
jgi:hypothetical protein